MCEVWTEAESELRAEGVETFLCGDDEIADSIRRGAEDFAIRLQQNARQFVAQNHQVEVLLSCSDADISTPDNIVADGEGRRGAWAA